MPEGPEIHIAARFINNVGRQYQFGGPIIKSSVSTKNPDVHFDSNNYNISAEARGKELLLFLRDSKSEINQVQILFHFGMSGCWKLTTIDEIPKHAHLQFYTNGKSKFVLSFVDYRRFGRWFVGEDWGGDRGPDPILDYPNFRQNVLDNLDKAEFSKAICETMLNQKYFNGVGNYLRAEVLFRAGVCPFTRARDILQPLKEDPEATKNTGDVLALCSEIMGEVVGLETCRSYDPDSGLKSADAFSEWLRCYSKEGMHSAKDNKGRTIWFQGDPGPLVPKGQEKGRKRGIKGEAPLTKDIKTEIKSEIKSENEDAKDKKVNKNKKKSDVTEKRTRKKKLNKNGETNAKSEIKKVTGE